MALIKRKEFTNGNWMTWIEVSPTGCEVIFFDNEPTEADAQSWLDNWNVEHQYDNTPQLPVSVYDAKDAIEDAVVYIKTTSSLTLAKWNTYIATLKLDDQYAVKWFIVIMAKKLAEVGEITLANNTELTILAQMRTWFINTPAARIRKIFYGTQN